MLKTIRLSLLVVVSLVVLLPATAAFAFEGHAFSASFGPEGPGSSTFQDVQGVAVDQASGDVYVYDDGSGSIYKFDGAGEKADFSGLGTNVIAGVGGAGEDEEELAVDSSTGPDRGDLYAANNREVRIYDSSSGHLLGTLSGGEPCGVAVDPSGEVYVGYYPSLVRKYTPHTNPVTSADYTSALYELNGVCNVAADSGGDVYVNTYLHGVRKYAASQFNTSEIAAVSTPPETIFDELGGTLAVDPSGNDVYVDEVGDLAQYTSSGVLLSRFGEAGSVAVLSGSYGIAVNASTGTDASGDIYVSSGAGAIDIYEPITVAATSPSIEGESVGSIESSAAKLEAQVNPHDDETTCAFQYVTGAEFSHSEYATHKSALCEPVIVGEGGYTTSTSANITGLEPAMVYHYRIAATNHTGAAYGPDQTFTTLPLAPEVNTGQATLGVGASEVVTGTVNPRGGGIWNTEYQVQYGLSAAYGSQVQSQAGTGDSTMSISSVIPELQPGITYHYRVIAKNAGGESIGTDGTFTVGGVTPVVGSESALFVNEHSAMIQGELNPQGAVTAYEIQYGPSTAYGSSSASIEIAPFTSSQGTLTEVVGLIPGTTYHYRLVATNPAGTTYGQDETFRTAGATPTTAFTSFAIPTVPQIAVTPFTLPGTGPDTKSTPKALTPKQKLAAALKACARKPKSKRATCKKKARKLYAPKPKNKK